MSERFTVDKGEDDDLPVFYDGEISITYDEVCQKLNEAYNTITELAIDNRKLKKGTDDFFDGVELDYVDGKTLMKSTDHDSKWCEVMFKQTPSGDILFEVKSYKGDNEQ